MAKTDSFAGVKIPRSPVYGMNSMVVSGHSQASIAGLRILERGGSLVDAMIATSAALSVVLVIGAAVFFRSYDAARQLDVGYAKEHLLTVRLDGVGFEEPPRLDERAVTAVADRL